MGDVRLLEAFNKVIHLIKGSDQVDLVADSTLEKSFDRMLDTAPSSSGTAYALDYLLRTFGDRAISVLESMNDIDTDQIRDIIDAGNDDVQASLNSQLSNFLGDEVNNNDDLSQKIIDLQENQDLDALDNLIDNLTLNDIQTLTVSNDYGAVEIVIWHEIARPNFGRLNEILNNLTDVQIDVLNDKSFNPLKTKIFPVNSLFNRELSVFSNGKTGARENSRYCDKNQVL